jgi:CRP-like cAMP-binding protein
VLTKDGRKILMRWLTAGEIFGGASALVNPYHYLASTEMASAGCALVWDRRTIRDLVTRIPRLLDNGLSIAVTEHIAWLLAMHISLATNDAMGRIAHVLVSLACGIGVESPNGIEIPVANEDLAAGANVTPFTVSRALSAWQREGILTKGRGKVVLCRPQLLISQ